MERRVIGGGRAAGYFVPGLRCGPSRLRNRAKEDRKAGPTPGFPFSRTGFAFDMTVFGWRAISLRFAHDEDSGAKERREARALGHETRRTERAALANYVEPVVGPATSGRTR